MMIHVYLRTVLLQIHDKADDSKKNENEEEL